MWGLRGVVWALAARVAGAHVAQGGGVRRAGDARRRRCGSAHGALDAARAQQAGNPEITFQPSGLRLVAKPGATLLDLAESGEQPIEAGCRMGVCGADPVCVVAGMENLSRDLQRRAARRSSGSGYADNTRMACCARINGPVTISLTPERAGATAPKRVEGFEYDRTSTRVVIVGNGIAGVTAADHVRRRHPDCQIDVVANEPYPLYNRMGIGAPGVRQLGDGRAAAAARLLVRGQQGHLLAEHVRRRASTASGARCRSAPVRGSPTTA